MWNLTNKLNKQNRDALIGREQVTAGRGRLGVEGWSPKEKGRVDVDKSGGTVGE